jgi:hypothetical protein
MKRFKTPTIKAINYSIPLCLSNAEIEGFLPMKSTNIFMKSFEPPFLRIQFKYLRPIS